MVAFLIPAAILAAGTAASNLISRAMTNNGVVRAEEWQQKSDGSASFNGFDASPIQRVGTVKEGDFQKTVVLNPNDKVPEGFQLKYSQRVITRTGDWMRGGEDATRSVVVKADTTKDKDGNQLTNEKTIAEEQAKQLDLTSRKGEDGKKKGGIEVGVTGHSSVLGPVFSSDFEVKKFANNGAYISSQETESSYTFGKDYELRTDYDQGNPENVGKSDTSERFRTDKYATAGNAENGYKQYDPTKYIVGDPKDMAHAYDKIKFSSTRTAADAKKEQEASKTA